MKIVNNLFLVSISCLLSSNILAQNLTEHQWENRILIIHTTDKNSDLYQKQIHEFTNTHEDLKDRKMVIYLVVNKQYQLIDYVNDKQGEWRNINGKFKGISFKNHSFKIALIGLDGRVKLEKEEILEKSELFQIIDSMPMRADELRNREK